MIKKIEIKLYLLMFVDSSQAYILTQGFDVTRKLFHGCFKVFELNCFSMPEVTNFYLRFFLFFFCLMKKTHVEDLSRLHCFVRGRDGW